PLMRSEVNEVDMNQPLQVAVLGGGSFGTAIANIIADNGHRTYLWMRDEENARQMQAHRENTRYLPGYPPAESLRVTSDLAAVVEQSDLVFVSIPSHSFRQVVRLIRPLLRADAMVVSTAKGIEPGEPGSFTLMSQILEQELPGVPIGVLSGPNFAKEIVQK